MLIPEKGADADQTKSEPLRRHSRLRRSNRAVATTRNDRDDHTAISRQDLDLPCPLSALTNGMQHIPVRDICACVHRPVETRRQEARQRQGRIPRPPNPFMLYRLAYSDRAKHWLAQNDDRAISILTGRSWTMEAPHIRKKYKTLAVMEKRNHGRAHPGYRFPPSIKKKRSQTARACSQKLVLGSEAFPKVSRSS
ncbi:transcriptional regulator family: HMG [Aspergillus niger]|nr:transcriptional regulator family: HMG [Aspergillus niger]KAI2868202.1 transcriptional regulator family: HMG [Aspergillus niger]KAI2948618.1 transcriptional regulator family: HMG [Aspergillus niger]KAI3031477.1 transcriptional regulator family: HMG [Aspergillus niger]